MARHPKLSEKTLELLGLKTKDMQVYSAMLRLGTAPLRRVAEEAGLNRGTTYDALKRLLEHGLVSHLDAKRHRYYTAEDPSKLRGLATRREVAIQEARAAVQEIIPELQTVLGRSEHRPAVRYLEGEAGVRDLLEDVLATTERSRPRQYRVYSSAAVRDLIALAWPGFNKVRLKQNIEVRAIAIGEGGRKHGLDERKWLSKESQAPTYMFIYADKTAHVSVDEHRNLFGVIVQDRGIASTQMMIFDALWEQL